MKRLLLIFSIFTVFTGCAIEKDYSDKKEFSFENIYGEDTLQIKVNISDCGEWGGHSEQLDIFRSDDHKLKLHFRRDTVNCPNPTTFNRRVIEEWTEDLSTENQTDIMNFIKSLTTLTFKHEGINHAGNHYKLTRTSGGLVIMYSDYSSNWTGYEELKNKITTANKT